MKPNILFKTLLAAGAFLAGMNANAQLGTNTFTFNPDASIPDNDLSGVADTRTLISTVIAITDLHVTLNMAVGFNGDYYVYLTHGSGFTVLLNRAGRTSGNDFGDSDSGFDVTFVDGAPNGDIHNYQLTLNPNGGTLTGTWEPDARNISPTLSLDTTPRSAFLSSFNGLNANGDWTLFVVDASPVGSGLLNSWGLEIIGTVPEPGTVVLFGMGAAILTVTMRRRKRQD